MASTASPGRESGWLYELSPIAAGGHDDIPGPGQAGGPWRAMIGRKFYVHTIFRDAQFLGNFYRQIFGRGLARRIKAAASLWFPDFQG